MKTYKNRILTILLLVVMSIYQYAYGETIVTPGPVTSDHWDLEGSPYIVTGDIQLTAGNTLTIDFGTAIKFDSGASFTIAGTLCAIGTETDKITFTSSQSSPSSGDWEGLKFEDESSSDSRMEQCVIEYAQTGVYFFECNATIQNSDIRYCSSSGILVKAITYSDCSGGHAAPSIDGCTIELNSGDGIKFEAHADTGCIGFTPTAHVSGKLRNSFIRFNGASGVNIESWKGYYSNAVNDTEIIDNLITGNSQYGIRVSGSKNANPKILANSITDNTGDGIYCNALDGDAVIRFNTISGNHNGIFNNTVTTIVEYNSLTENLANGIETIELAAFTGNCLESNDVYCIYYSGSTHQTASNNYWGTSNQASIDDCVYDCNDNSSTGCVNYMPLNTVCDSTAPTVVSTEPSDSATNVIMNMPLRVTFSEPMDDSTITASNFQVTDGQAAIPGAISYSGLTAEFSPEDPTDYTPLTLYEVVLSTDMTDRSGNPLSTEYRWSFTTGITIDFIDMPGFRCQGAAYDGENLWISDSENNMVYEIDPETADIIRSFATPGSFPTGLAFDSDYLWSADLVSDKLYKINSINGTVELEFASPGDQPKGLAYDGAYLWNADSGTDRIYCIDPITGLEVTSFKSPGLNPYGLAYGGTYLWLTDVVEGKLYQLDTIGNVISEYILAVTSPSGLAFDGTWLRNADPNDNKIYRLCLPDKVGPLGSTPGIIAPLVGETMEIKISGGKRPYTLLVSDSSIATATLDGYIVRVTGAVQGSAAISITDSLSSKFDILVTVDGSNIVDSFSSPGSRPCGLAYDGDFLWHADQDTDLIYKINTLDGSPVSSFSSPGAYPVGLAFDGAYLWNADIETDTLYRIDPSSGAIISTIDTPGDVPQGLTHDGTSLWIGNFDSKGSQVFKIDQSTGAILSSFESPGPGVSGLAWDGNYLWVATDKIYKVTRAGLVITSFDVPGFIPGGLTWDGQYLWHADWGTDMIYKLMISLPAGPPCECDLNHDGRCDMQDWLMFGEDWGRTDCGTPAGSGNEPNDCECDLNADGKCDMTDWLKFGEDWGRTDCPTP